MAILEKCESKNSKRPFIDISGPNGNAFTLIGQAIKLAKKFGKDENSIVNRMMEGNYQELLEVFDSEFGEYVDILK